MSTRPNISDDPQAPLLAGDRAADGTDEDPESSGNKSIKIFNKTFSLFHIIAIVVGVLALTAIGISIAAIGTYRSIYC
jgi:hypothetical protein